jgi:hypothetical protein
VGTNQGTAGAPSPTETEADRQPHFDFANFCDDPEAWLGTVSIFLFEKGFSEAHQQIDHGKFQLLPRNIKSNLSKT